MGEPFARSGVPWKSAGRKPLPQFAAPPWGWLTSGSTTWIDNDQPESVLSFLRKHGNEEILVIINVSNRNVHVTVDLPVMDYYAVQNLLNPGKTWFSLYSGRVSTDLDAFGYILGRKIPLAPLEK